MIFNPVFTVDPTHESWLTAASSLTRIMYILTSLIMLRGPLLGIFFLTGYQVGDWWQGASRGEIVHEFGHLLDLDDLYDEKTGKPFPGFENDVMAMEYEVSQFDLNNSLAGRACGCQTKQNFHFGH